MADESDRGRQDPVALRAGYEQLRAQVLAGRPDGWRLGHAALARGGIAGWIAASAAAAPVSDLTRSRPGPPADGMALASLPTGEIVAVLCEMALAHAA